MRTPRQQKNHENLQKQKQRIIKWLNTNDMFVWYLIGVMLLAMVGALAVAVS